MTQLIVTPIDMSAKGSFKLRKRLLTAYADMQEAIKSNDIRALTAAYDTIEAMVRDRLETDDGTPVADALEEASAEQFDQLMGGLLGEPTIPNARSAT
jgi:hypothetical protein